MFYLNLNSIQFLNTSQLEVGL